MATTQECCEQYWTGPGGSHPKKQQLYGHLPPIMKTIQVRRTRHAGHCWRSWDELISDVILWTPTHGRAKAGWPVRTYLQLCEDTGCSPEDLPKAINDREGWQEWVRDIRDDGTTRWWWLTITSYEALTKQLAKFTIVCHKWEWGEPSENWTCKSWGT